MSLRRSMSHPRSPARPSRSSRVVAAGVATVALASLALASPALGQVDPGASSTTEVAPSTSVTTGVESSTTVPDGSSTTEVPAETTGTAGTDTTVPPPVAVDTPFPVALVAPVPPVEGAPDTAITDLYVTDGVDPASPDVVVQFREPFTFAGTPYQVGVVIGDPSGTRLRTWLISNGPDALPYGRVERFEAGSWQGLGATPVRFESGLMVITIPIEQAPAGGAIWAEIVENGADTPSHTTPFFSRDALFGAADAGTIPSAIFGRVFGLDGVSPDVVPELPTGGTLVSIEDRIAVSYPAPPPTEVIGAPVTEAVDTIRIAPDYDGGAIIAHFVRFNRTTGDVGLYDGFSPVPIDKTGDRSWLLSAPAAGQPGDLVLDRPAIMAALGIPDGGADTALGVSREIALGDGRVVTAEGVLGTDAWLDLAPASALPEVTTTVAPAAAPTAGGDDTATRLPLLIGAAAGLVVLLLLVLLVRRLRGRNEDTADIMGGSVDPEPTKVDRMPWGSSDGDLIITTTHEFDALIPADATPLPAPRPVDPATTAAAGGAAASGVRILANPVTPASTPEPEAPAPAVPADAVAPGAAPADPVAEPVAPPVEASPLDADPVWATPAGAPRSPAAAAPAAPAPAAGGGAPDPDPLAEAPEVPASAPGEAVAAEGPVADADDDADDDGAPEELLPGRVDPMAALSALDDDMAELRRRVASLGE